MNRLTVYPLIIGHRDDDYPLQSSLPRDTLGYVIDQSSEIHEFFSIGENCENNTRTVERAWRPVKFRTLANNVYCRTTTVLYREQILFGRHNFMPVSIRLVNARVIFANNSDST